MDRSKNETLSSFQFVDLAFIAFALVKPNYFRVIEKLLFLKNKIV
ncbi:hypothetical protein LEP1GSC060_0221 [Leptospira weilii serovar Ranarum str. ICFT]|uniref:Uncharacterized protein n=1 Tax=Leptospira weilii serovar Ranarum str. ICFT TaxID=1218598 RepID=N1WBZ8_9LEPT|nr:hypothetical protein LEP1GSC060_0221 [Leptospira weilii serovar Ranarum str. ICFT]